MEEQRAGSQTRSEIKTENFTCPSCGGRLQWDIEKQEFACSSCRAPGKILSAESKVVEHPFENYAGRDAEQVVLPDQVTIICQSCGAQVFFTGEQTAVFCPMCGSSQVSQDRQVAGVPPDGIIPFRISAAQAQQNFHKWIKSRWFAPNQIKKAYQVGKLDGMYLPYWTFDMEADAWYTGEGGTRRQRTDKKGNTTIYIDWTSVSGSVSGGFDDIPVCASENRVNAVIDTVFPYSTSGGCVPYSSAYLSGFMAERYAVRADEAVEEAKAHVHAQMKKYAVQDIEHSYDEARVTTLDVEYRDLRYKHVLLPAWSSAFSYRGKQYLYLINGETGKVGGQRPYSVWKILAAVLAGAALVAGVIFALEWNRESSAQDQPAQSIEAVIAEDTL